MFLNTNMKPFFSIHNCFSSEQLAYLESLEQNFQADYHTGNYTDRGQVLGLSTEKDMTDDILNEIYDMIKDKVEENIGTLYPTYGVFSKGIMPMTEHIDVDPTHIDYNKSPAYTIVIPLKSNYTESTIVWNAVKKDMRKPIGPRNIIMLEDSDYTYTEAEKKITSHCEQKNLKHLGKPYMFKHNRGDIIFWKREYIHASSTSSNYNYVLDTKSMKPELNELDVNTGSFKTLDKVVKRFLLLLTRWDR
jgi:hypothetical protein